ncbi:MAG: hemerythrin family protein [Magnetococcales bacterium]|nr:hemerythrin family protein [Magnetococcales bacterium]
MHTSDQAPQGDGFQRHFSLEEFRANMRARLKDVEIPALHGQHEQLVELIVRLYGEVRTLQKETPDTDSVASLRGTLQELKSYATRHFQEEEAFMHRINYPGVTAHCEAHRVFVKSLLDLEARIWRESISFVVDLLHLVVGWLFQHINQLDMGYARFSKGGVLPKGVTEPRASPALQGSSGIGPASGQTGREISFRESMLLRLRKTGIDPFDQEHVELMNRIVHINTLTKRLTSRPPTPKDWAEIDQAVEFLMAYTRYHFSGEEAWMNKVGYPKRGEHAQEHQRLLARLKELVERLTQERNVYFIVDMNLFVTEWFLTHTVRADSLYGEFAKSRKLS